MSFILVRSTMPRVVHLSSSYIADPTQGPGGVKAGPSMRVYPGIGRYDADAYAACMLNVGSKHYFDSGEMLVVSEEEEPDRFLLDMSEGQALATIAEVLDSGEAARELLHEFLEVETRPNVKKALRARLEEFGDEEDEHEGIKPTTRAMEKVVLAARLKKAGQPTATASRVAAAKEKKSGKGNAA